MVVQPMEYVAQILWQSISICYTDQVRTVGGSLNPELFPSPLPLPSQLEVGSQPCFFQWYRHGHHCRSRLCFPYTLWGWRHSFLFPLNPSCLRLPISAQLRQQGPRYQIHIGRHSSATACSSMRLRGAEDCLVQIGSLGGTTVA